MHSPAPSGTTQVAGYRPLRLPTILVGDSNLGGISSTISAYESLILRGYDVDAVILFQDNYYRNSEYLEEWFAERNGSTVGPKIRVGVVPKPPVRNVNLRVDHQETEEYYRMLEEYQVTNTQAPEVETIINHLDDLHYQRLSNLHSTPSRTRSAIWWPFVQHKHYTKDEDVTVIDSAHSDFFSVFRTQPPEALASTSTKHRLSLLTPLFDGSASWWTQAVGHSHPDLTYAAAYASGRYGHVMFPLASHEPALLLAERLLKDGPGQGWASRVFFSDNGSTGMEVALKMAMKATRSRYRTEVSSMGDVGVLGMKGSYHGDTIGAMDASEANVFNKAVDWYRGRGYWFDVPTISVRSGKYFVSGPDALCSQPLSLNETIKNDSNKLGEWCLEFNSLQDIFRMQHRLQSPLADSYRASIQGKLEGLVAAGQAFGALVIEPLVMGAGGMLFVDPLFQRVLVDVVRSREDLFGEAFGAKLGEPRPEGAWRGLPVIYDEVFTGLYRLGVQSPSTVLDAAPDISVLAKILTGGTLPLSATLATDSIFEAFWGDQKTDALLHGHSYTAHPIGCAIANETLKMLDNMKTSGEWITARARWGLPTTSPQGNEKDLAPEIWSFWDPAFVRQLSSMEMVDSVMTLGTVLAFRFAPTSSNTNQGE